MKRIRQLQKRETKNTLVALSIVALILTCLFVNDQMGRASRPILISDNAEGKTQIEKLNRAIANAQPLNLFRDYEWEQGLAKKLAMVGERNPASVGRAVSSVDGLRFGPLAGKYRVLDQANSSGNKITLIDYIESADSNDRPVFLDPEIFLQNYGKLLAVDFEMYDRANPSQPQVREYRLLDSEMRVVGMAAFTIDDDGRFLSLKVAAITEK